MAINKEKIEKKSARFAQAGKYEQAAEELQKIIDANPGDIKTINKIGDLYSRAGKTREAINNFNTIAQHYSKEGFYAKAIAVYKKITKIDPKNNAAYYRLSDLYIKEDLPNEARESLIIAAQNFMEKGDRGRAKEAYQKILEVQPESIKVRIKLAEIHEKEKNIEDAVKEYLYISNALIEKRLDKEAQSVLEKIVKIQAGNIEAANQLVDIYTRSGNNHQAISLYKKILKDEPDNIEAMLSLGRTYYNMNEIKKANSVIKQIIKKAPDEAEAVNLSAKIALQEGRIDEAFQHINKAMNLKFPEGPDSTAPEMISPLIEKDPYYVPALEKMLEVYTALSDINSTISIYEKIGIAYRHNNMPEKALEAYNKVLDFNPENKKAQLAIGELNKQITDEIPRSSEQAIVGDEDVIAVGDVDFGLSGESGTAGIDIEAQKEYRESAVSQPVKPSREAQPVKEISNETIYEIEILIKYGLLDKAIRQLSDIAESHPNDRRVRKLLKAIYMERGDKVKATLEDLHLADIYHNEGDIDAAKRLKDKALVELESLQQQGAELPPEVLAMIGEGAVAIPEVGAAEFPDVEEVEIGHDEISIAEELDESEYERGKAADESISLLSEDLVAEDIDIQAIDLDEQAVSQEGAVQSEVFKSERVQEDDSEIDSILDNSIMKEKDSSDVILSPQEAGDIQDSLESELKIDDLFSAIAGESSSEEIDQIKNSGMAEHDVFADLASEFERDTYSSDVPAHDEITDEDMESMLTSGMEGHTVEEEDDLVSQIFEAQDDLISKDIIFQLEEVDFYIDQEFYEEAKAKLRDLQQQHPNNPGVRERLQTLAERAAASEIQKFHEEFSELRETVPDEIGVNVGQDAVSANDIGKKPEQAVEGLNRSLEPIEQSTSVISDEDLFKEEEEFFNIAQEIESEISIPTPTTNVNLEAQLESVFDEFRDEINESVGEEDAETRYNLGIAYKEMDLVDEAIQEFQAASKRKDLQLKASTMLGYCFMEKQLPVQSAQWFQKALNSVNRDTPREDVLGIKFALAQAYMADGDNEEAVTQLNSILEMDPNYPGVQEMMKQIYQ